jgi:hypothetical protein
MGPGSAGRGHCASADAPSALDTSGEHEGIVIASRSDVGCLVNPTTYPIASRCPATPMGLSDIGNLDYAVLRCLRMTETCAFFKAMMGFPIVRDLDARVSFRAARRCLRCARTGVGRRAGGARLRVRAARVLTAAARRRRLPRGALCCVALLARKTAYTFFGCAPAKGVPILCGPADLPVWRDPEDSVIAIYAES